MLPMYCEVSIFLLCHGSSTLLIVVFSFDLSILLLLMSTFWAGILYPVLLTLCYTHTPCPSVSASYSSTVHDKPQCGSVRLYVHAYVFSFQRGFMLLKILFDFG